ncbi:MAG TPA: CvpA family protein [Burkholderiales bacterium]|nr:CvpA family protein [Burkholderiales bacterium]
MTWLDYAVLGVIAASVALGIWRGLVREVISVLGWVIAFLAANLFAGPLGAAMPQSIPTPGLRVAAAFVVVFVGALAASSLAGLLLSRIVKAVGLGGLDRGLGTLFGAARGLLMVLAAALLAGLTSAPKQPFWRDSLSGGPMARAALALKPWLPETLAGRLRYD